MFAHWDRIECDLHEFFGVDVATGILRRRPRSWLQKRLFGLLLRNSTLRTALRPDQEGPGL